MDESTIELQTRVAFQEDTIEQLSGIVAEQQKTLDHMRCELVELRESLSDLKRNLPDSKIAEAPPPHY